MKKKLRENIRLKGIAARIIAVVFCFYIFFAAWENRGITWKQWKDYWADKITFSKFIDNVSANFMSDIEGKNDYINLNGLYVRLEGQITDNNVVKLTNGMLTQTTSRRDMSQRSEVITDLSEYLYGKGIDFLYVSRPDKIDLEESLLPEGIETYSNENADEMLSLLEDAGVNTLDLRSYTAATAEDIETYFYKTDHHWNALGAFVGYQKLCEYIADIYHDSGIDENLLEEDTWTINVKEDWFLGSRGKRVGIYFGGVDDLLWMTPNFEVEMSCAIPYSNLYYDGSFEDAIIREKYYEGDEPDYFGLNNYCVTVGGDYAMVQFRQENAPSDLKLLLIGDSFTDPVEAFLACQSKEVDKIDLRHYTATTLAEFIEDSCPDIVALFISPTIDSEFFSYGLDTAPSLRKYADPLTALDIDEATYTAKDAIDNKNNFTLAKKLAPEAKYVLHISDIGGCGSEYVTIELTDNVNGKMLERRIVDIDYYNDTGGFSWTFFTSEDDLKYSLTVRPGEKPEPEEDAEVEETDAASGEDEESALDTPLLTLGGVTLMYMPAED